MSAISTNRSAGNMEQACFLASDPGAGGADCVTVIRQEWLLLLLMPVVFSCFCADRAQSVARDFSDLVQYFFWLDFKPAPGQQNTPAFRR